ncbi:MAG: biotin--[acetyl-CoA-carboxylase] ligase [Pyrinomonadaceae bacterium]
MNINILRYDTLGSTNTEAASQIRQGAAEGLCVIAGRQTAGRGRQGREWVSSEGAGLYFSIVLRPRIEMRFFPLVTLMAGVAVHDTLMEFGLKPDIKWVNDILIGDDKISGILAETVDTPAGTAVIVGIGINLTSSSFPEELAATATSLELETGNSVTADEVAERLTHHLSYFYDMLNDENGSGEIVHHWRQRSTYFSGKRVRVTLEGSTFEGTTDGLEENGALRVKTTDGSVTIVQAGDVERLRGV